MAENKPVHDKVGEGLPKELEWQTESPLLDRFKLVGIIKLLVVFVVFSAIALFLNLYLWIMVVLTVAFSVLVFLVIFGGQRHLSLRVDGKGAGFTAPMNVKGTNKIIGHVLIILGLYNGRPGAVVVGKTAASQAPWSSQGWGVEWKDVAKVSFYPKERVVLLKEKPFTGGLGGGLASLRLYCTAENYETVAAMSLKNFQERQIPPEKS